MSQLAGGNKLKSKIIKTVLLSIVLLLCITTIVVFEVFSISVGSSLAGIVFGVCFPFEIMSIQDFSDSSSWKRSQRKLKRGGFISKETTVRISFAYLYRIKVDGDYLLVPNGRNTGKFQPVGGVYKLRDEEKLFLKNKFHVADDDKIPLDESSKNDYRLRIKNKYLRAFVERFDNGARRENVFDLSREFKEELVNTGILDWKQIKYRYCGRHIAELRFGEHFQIYELLLADIVELMPTEEQLNKLRALRTTKSDLYRFASAQEITSLGVNTSKVVNTETIGDHTKNILQEQEDNLIKMKETGEIFTVNI